MRRVEKSDCLNANRRCRFEILGHIINKDGLNCVQLILVQQMLVNIHIRFDLLDAAGDYSAIKEIEDIVLTLQIGNRRNVHI